MLKICRNVHQLDFRQLMDVYEETNRINGMCAYPKRTENLQILFAEQDFYRYLDQFFKEPSAIYAVWAEGDAYKAALRLEKYGDGMLITALETAPAARKKGCAAALLEAVKLYSRDHAFCAIYSHVEKVNLPSIATHKKAGFSIIAEDAKFLDGTVRIDHYTLAWYS